VSATRARPLDNTQGIEKVSFEISDIKKRLYGIAAVNKLLELGKNVTKTVKGDPILEQLIQKIPGKIEIISAKAIK